MAEWLPADSQAPAAQGAPAQVAVPPGLAAYQSLSFREDLRAWRRWLYVHNPFYALSALLVFAGLRASFDTSGRTFQTGLLMAALSGYILLLAVSAVLVVRLGRVWDDARSLLLLVLVLLVAISATFDEFLARDRWNGTWFYLGGLGFSAALVGGLLKGIRLRLPGWYLVSLAAVLGVFFLYPVWIAAWSHQPASDALRWRLFGFSWAMAAAFLPLGPAIRRGPAYLAGNGSPWAWPWFPLSPFVLLGLAALVRAPYLCVSMHYVTGYDRIFAPYFWSPMFTVWAGVTLELAIAQNSRLGQRLMLLVPLGMLLLTVELPASSSLSYEFQNKFIDASGLSPWVGTLWLAVGFYGWALWRGVGLAGDALTAALIALALAEPRSAEPLLANGPQFWPALAAVVVQALVAWRTGSPLRALLALSLCVGGLTRWQHGTWLTAWGWFLPLHFLLAGLMVLAAVTKVRYRVVFERMAVALLLALVALMTWDRQVWFGHLPAVVARLYLPVVAVVCGVGAWQSGRWIYGLVTCGALAVGGAMGLFEGYAALRRQVPGLGAIALGLVSFLVAAGVSLRKALLAGGQDPGSRVRQARRARGPI